MTAKKLSHDILLRQLELGAEERPFVLIGVLRTEGPTAIRAGNKAIILSDGSIEGWVGGHCTENEIVSNALSCLKDGVSRSLNLTTCQGGRMSVYLEPYLPKRKLLVYGHVPIVEALARLGKSLNFNVAVIDDHASSASEAKFEGVDIFLKASSELRSKAKINPRETFAVVATMGENDQSYVMELLDLGLPYIGVVAGKRRASEIFSYLRASGVSEENVARVRSPAGIYIRAVTAEEIALSIMAEIVEVARTRGDDPRQYWMAPELSSGGSSNPSTSAWMETRKTDVSIDPVCGMTVGKETEAEYYSLFEGRKVVFCCEACKSSFDADPQKYVLEQNHQ